MGNTCGNCNCRNNEAENELDTAREPEKFEGVALKTNTRLNQKLVNQPIEEDPMLLANNTERQPTSAFTQRNYDKPTRGLESLRPDVVILDRMPDFSNPSTRETIKKLGGFRYDGKEREEHGLQEYGPVEFENNCVYIGQWKNTLKHGKGKQLWNGWGCV